MSHIVIHDDVDGVTQFRQFDDLGNAVTFLEEQQNAATGSNAKLYELNEVHFEVKSYVKIEIVDDDAASIETAETADADDSVEMAAESVETAEPESESTDEPVAVAPDEVTPAAEMSYVEAAMAEPIEAFASEAFAPADPAPEFAPPEPEMADSNPGADVRRGLFGR